MAFDPNVDYASKIKDAINSGGTADDVSKLLAQRMEKINSNSSLSKYANDDLNLAASSYIQAQNLKQNQDDMTAKYNNLYSSINSQYDQNLAAEKANIENTKNKLISGFNDQIAAAPQQYQANKDEASYNGAVQGNRIKEAMAAGGQGVSGTNLSAQSANNASTSGQIANINVSQQNLVNSLKKAISDAQSSASYQELEATANSNSQRAQAIKDTLNNQINMDNQNYWNKVNATGMMNGTPTMAGQQNTANLQYQNIQNQLAQMQLQNYPEEEKLKIQQIQQELTKGNIDIGTAQQRMYNIQSGTTTSSKTSNKTSSKTYEPNTILNKLTQMKNATIETGKTGNGSGLMTTYVPRYTTEDLWNYLMSLGIDEDTAGGYMSQIGY